MKNTIKTIQPLFKYIGGKSWLREKLRKQVFEALKSKEISTYVEPFAGGLGSFLNIYDILLENNVKNVILSDINKILIETYYNIHHNPQKLIQEFLYIEYQFVQLVDKNWKAIQNKNELKLNLQEAEKFFNLIKKDFNQDKNLANIQQSARLIFLQKHSFNGIYRENSKGEYNTPFNWSGSHMLDSIETKVNEMNKLFHQFNLEFITKSFEELDYNQDTLYYLDPPYLNEKIGENKYHKNSFDISKQLLLIQKIKDVSFIYSNHKSETLLHEFNKIEGVNIQEIARKNIMSSNTQSRKEDKIEILISKY
jgi:DNA adenine methylase